MIFRTLVRTGLLLAALTGATQAEAAPPAKKAAPKAAPAKPKKPPPPEPPPPEPPAVANPIPAVPNPIPATPPSTSTSSLEEVTLLPVVVKKVMTPGQFDLRVMGNLDVVLAFVGVGASGDIGIVRAGPGTIAVGAGVEYAFCASVCWLLNTVTPLDFGQNQLSIMGRGSYHIPIGSKIDVYPMVMIGPTFANAHVKLDDNSVEYRGKDTAIAFGGGAGVSFFLGERFFLGAEARLRYARGKYTYEVVAGDKEKKLTEGSVQTWSLTGLDFVGALGFRFF